MSIDEMQRFLDAELERAKAKREQAVEALQQADADVERIKRARAAYGTTPEEVEPPTVRPRRVIPKILANGKRMTREELLAALKGAGWSVTYEGREFTKTINANLWAGHLAFDGHRYYYPDDAERERIQRDNRRKKKR
jgi:hypothetical protein